MKFGWRKKRNINSTSRGRVPSHLSQRFEALDSIRATDPPAPWRKLDLVPIGGLTAVGFDDKSKYLLVVSHDGIGVIDCKTGKKVAREDDRAYDTDVGTLMIQGIGPLENQLIRIAGILGGGLPKSTYDGWSIDVHPLSWPEDELYLLPATQTLLWSGDNSVDGITKLPSFATEVVAFGFSPNGKVLIVATSSDVNIYIRT